MPKTKATASRKPVQNHVSLSSRDICKIIKQCHDSGVLSLSIQGLDIKLIDAVKKPIPLPTPVQPEELPKAAETPFEDTPLGDEASQLMIDDPELYESLHLANDVR